MPTHETTVHVDLTLPVEQAGRLLVSLAVARHLDAQESLTADGADGPVAARTVTTGHGTRLHLLEVPEGDLTVT